MPALRVVNQYTYHDVLNAYFDCRRRKRTKRSAVAFETNFEHSLEGLLEEINGGEYRIGPSRVFVVLHPKAREVWAAGFRDRIVHHLVYNDIGHWYESRFIEDTFSCIPGRGTQAAQAVAKEPLSIARISTLNSYLGMMRHTSAYTLRSKLCRVARTPTLIGHDAECTKIIKL